MSNDDFFMKGLSAVGVSLSSRMKPQGKWRLGEAGGRTRLTPAFLHSAELGDSESNTPENTVLNHRKQVFPLHNFLKLIIS